MENVIHKTLKSLSRISESEGNPGKLKQSKWHRDRCLMDVIRSNRNLMEGANQINLGEKRGSVKSVGEIVDVVSVRNSDCIKSAIISTRTPITLGLLRHHMVSV